MHVLVAAYMGHESPTAHHPGREPEGDMALALAASPVLTTAPRVSDAAWLAALQTLDKPTS